MTTLIVTVALALVGYLATYLNGVRLAQRQARLARVNLQLSDFYGPLFALMEANSRTYDTFSGRHARPDGRDPFDHDIPPTERELAKWRTWAGTVFIPNIQAMRDVVVTKADLLIEQEMPPALLQLCAHVSGYEITAARDGHRGATRAPVGHTFPGAGVDGLHPRSIHTAEEGTGDSARPQSDRESSVLTVRSSAMKERSLSCASVTVRGVRNA